MRKNRSQYASKKYPNLYKYPSSPFWVFRKYSKEKRREFAKSTCEPKDEARAYRIGVKSFEDWVGSELPTGRTPLFRDVARVVLASKEGMKRNTYRSAENQIMNHLIPAFGHLRVEQVTLLQWQRWIAGERRRHPGKKFANARKHLLEILRRAQDEGIVRKVPRIQNPDPEVNSGRYLTDGEVMSLLQAASPGTQLLAEIVWRMGARPGEVLQWEYGMIRWDEGPTGAIDIPGRITKTGRSRTIPLNPVISERIWERQKTAESPFLFPSPHDPTRPAREYKTGWRSACARAGIDASLYWLRHTFVTNCAKRGVSIVFAARYIDTSVAMIDKVYAKATPEAMNEVAGVDSDTNSEFLKKLEDVNEARP